MSEVHFVDSLTGISICEMTHSQEYLRCTSRNVWGAHQYLRCTSRNIWGAHQYLRYTAMSEVHIIDSLTGISEVHIKEYLRLTWLTHKNIHLRCTQRNIHVWHDSLTGIVSEVHIIIPPLRRDMHELFWGAHHRLARRNIYMWNDSLTETSEVHIILPPLRRDMHELAQVQILKSQLAMELQHTATHCNTLQYCNTETHCNTLWHTATHCNTLQHTAAQKLPLHIPHTWYIWNFQFFPSGIFVMCDEKNWMNFWFLRVFSSKTPAVTLRCVVPGRCNTLQHTATHCNTLQHTATHCNTLQHNAAHCNILQRIATHRNILQHTSTHCNTP